MKGSQYQKEVESLLTSLQKNIRADYDGQFDQQNEKNILKLYQQVYKFSDRHKRQKQYQKLKGSMTNQTQLKILQWFQTVRSKKYSGDTLPHSKAVMDFQSTKLCINPDLLRSKRIIENQPKDIYSDWFAQLNEIQLQLKNRQGKSNKYRFFLNIQDKSKKIYLFKQFKNRLSNPTPWVIEKTKDGRFVWRGDIKIDHFDVQTLLKFILAVRSKQSEKDCPSILINVGCHGGNVGQNAFQSGNLKLTDMNIYYQTVHEISEIVDKGQYKLTQNNIKEKIYLHPLSTVSPCVYPQNADHIIDVLCNGAKMKINASQLHILNNTINEKDLLFLYGNQTEFDTELNSELKECKCSIY